MLIVGCGAVGRRIATLAAGAGDVVHCVVRGAASAAALHSDGLSAQAIDLDTTPPPDATLAFGREIFYLAPPPSQGRSDPRIGRFLAALGDRAARIVYISTSGVYGDCRGEWVDETRPTAPRVDRARRRVDAERQLRDWRARSGGELVILRVAGIYGRDKLPLERLRRALPMVGEDEAPWTNRIHIDDLVQVCAAAMARGRDGAVYNVSDGRPGNMRDYFDRVADLYGIARAPLIRLADADGRLSAGLLSYLAESRRLDNRRMLDELGVTLAYPTLAQGLAASAPSSDPERRG